MRATLSPGTYLLGDVIELYTDEEVPDADTTWPASGTVTIRNVPVPGDDEPVQVLGEFVVLERLAIRPSTEAPRSAWDSPNVHPFALPERYDLTVADGVATLTAALDGLPFATITTKETQ